MATADQNPGVTTLSTPPGSGLLVLLAAMDPEQRERAFANLAASFPKQDLVVATQDATLDASSDVIPDAFAADSYPSLRIVAAPASDSAFTLTAADFVNACQLAAKHQARAILMLGPESGSLGPPALHELASAVLGPTDLAVPCYDLLPRAGLVNSAILYPLTRALFASSVRFPLAVDLGLSLRMARRLGDAAQHFTAINQGETPLWPVNEATVAGFAIDQINVGATVQPAAPELNVILPLVVGPLFSDINAKAAFWQRFRPLPPAHPAMPLPPAPATDVAADIAPMLAAFRLAYTNLHEIWSLVLPPDSLLRLKRLATADAAVFRISDRLWARIVYDFLLAYRLRTINRGHLLGALIPLYLAWVASHFNAIASGSDSEEHIEEVAAAFETEKTYMVSRWRWPDRFNP
jgi:hypothetical protein